jgi:hypothetical protein
LLRRGGCEADGVVLFIGIIFHHLPALRAVLLLRKEERLRIMPNDNSL